MRRASLQDKVFRKRHHLRVQGIRTCPISCFTYASSIQIPHHKVIFMSKYDDPRYVRATARRRTLEHFGIEKGSVVLYEDRYAEGGNVVSFFYPATVNSLGQGGYLSLRCYGMGRHDHGDMSTKNQVGFVPVKIWDPESNSWINLAPEYLKQLLYAQSYMKK